MAVMVLKEGRGVPYHTHSNSRDLKFVIKMVSAKGKAELYDTVNTKGLTLSIYMVLKEGKY